MNYIIPLTFGWIFLIVGFTIMVLVQSKISFLSFGIAAVLFIVSIILIREEKKACLTELR